MKHLVSCFILLCGALLLTAQAPQWQWAVRGGGSSYDEGLGIAIDSQGNQYITGVFEGTATFGTITLTSQGQEDIFVAKLDPYGSWLWVQRAGGNDDNDLGLSIAVDSDGNSYVTGGFVGSANFGGLTLLACGEQDIFVAKLDTSGNWLWAVQAGGINDDRGDGIALDSAGCVIVTGGFMGSANFGLCALSSAGGTDIFVAKLDGTGNWFWAVRAGSADPSYSNCIALDGSDNAYLTGFFCNSIAFGNYTLTSSGQYDVFAAKLDPTGNWLWAVRAGGSNEDNGYGIAVDSTGNAYLTGYFYGMAYFGPYTLSASGDTSIFAAKLDPAGGWIWAVQAGGLSYDEGYSITLDSTGNAYLTGNVFTPASFGSITLTSSAVNDIFAAKLEWFGDWQWAVSAGVTHNYQNAIILDSNIAVDTAGNTYLAGGFVGSAAFGTYTLTSNEYGDVFVAKLSPGTPVEDEFNPSAASFALSVNPNPFNPETTIAYTLPAAGSVSLEIYNSRGQLVRSLLLQEQSAGEHSLIWNGKDDSGHSVASGLYLCRIACNGKLETRKMLLLK
jgi:hypothetical protein